ncbi:unnamed protein product [Haemonchus placei]|uniref:Radical SAM protein n=1 Tax=Haemonchus placei TaxID=6290 RepID=A0A0N4X9S5_HAEPC|nr:unnamed protein product [Haemonchus placei]
MLIRNGIGFKFFIGAVDITQKLTCERGCLHCPGGMQAPSMGGSIVRSKIFDSFANQYGTEERLFSALATTEACRIITAPSQKQGQLNHVFFPRTTGKASTAIGGSDHHLRFRRLMVSYEMTKVKQ